MKATLIPISTTDDKPVAIDATVRERAKTSFDPKTQLVSAIVNLPRHQRLATRARA